jgi:phosphoglycerate dehydrogenase-like enzyme
MKVLLTWQATPAEIGAFAAALPPDALIVAQPPGPSFSRFDCSLESIAPDLEDSEVIAGWVLPEGALARARNLKLLIWMHAGCDELDFPTLKSRGVSITNIRGANAVSVAEHAIALLLGVAKRLPQAREAVLASRISPYYVQGQHSALLEGRTVGLVGLGQIGTAIAKRLRAFDMRVIATRRHPERPSEHVDAVYPRGALLEMLGLSDYVILATPLTRETDGLFGRVELAAMKPGAFLVNIARGNLVQEAALAEALESGRLMGYGTDVWWFYANAYPASYHFPVPSRTGIHTQPNVLGTGGQASNAVGVVERCIVKAIESVSDFVHHDPLRWRIDLNLEY